MSDKTRETVDRLMRLALADIPDSDTARKNEARNAAIKALQLISDHDMLVEPTPKGGKKKKKVPTDMLFEFRSVLEKIQSLDFDGAVRVIEDLKNRTQRLSAQRINNMRQDMEAKPTWTEMTIHGAHRATAIAECSSCRETILLWVWVVEPNRDSTRLMHLRCFRESKHA